MKIIDIDKRYVRDVYKNNVMLAIKAQDGVIFTEQNIVNAFCGTGGTLEEAQKRLKRFIQDNKIYSYYYDLENNIFL